MAIVSAVGRYLADIFFEPPEDPAVHDVHIVDLADHYRPDFAGETLSHILAAGPYDDTFARRLADLKYHRDRRDVGVFAETLDRLLRAAPEFDYVAVPPSPVLRRISRLWYRPMADICEHAGYADRLLPADSFEDSWYRGRQASRSRQERLRAFLDSPIRLRAGVRLDGAHIVVADDVLSTGATAHALARALRSAGAIVDTGIFLSSGAYPARHAHDSGI